MMLTYTPLKDADSFRLLRILPGRPPDIVQCHLRNTTIEAQKNRYLALSYTWGEVTKLQRIICDGSEVLVTPNLSFALHRLRLSDRVTTIWVDALCIDQGQDQKALAERAQQIESMGRIFGSAYEVIVDLGGPIIGFESVIACIEDLQSMENEPIEDLWSRQENKDELSKGFLELFKRNWFRRAFVYQEFLLAKHLVFLIGCHWIDGRAFRRVFNKLASYLLTMFWDGKVSDTESRYISVAADTFLAATAFQDSKPRSQTKISLNLPDILIMGMDLEVSDPRDRLYAFYGLADHHTLATLPAKYDERVEELGMRTASELLDQGRLDVILLQANGPMCRKSYPSWASGLDIGNWQATFFRSARQIYAAAISAQMAVVRTSHPKEIKGRASLVDEVHDLGLDLMCRAPVNLHDWLTLQWQEVTEWAKQHCKSQSDKEALGRVLTADVCFPHVGRSAIKYQRIPKSSPDFVQAFEDALSSEPRYTYPKSSDVVEGGAIWLALHITTPELHCGLLIGSDRRLCKTASGRPALMPSNIAVGDKVAIFTGVDVPYVLRPVEGGYEVVGPCFVHGVMDGEAMQMGSWKPEMITLC